MTLLLLLLIFSSFCIPEPLFAQSGCTDFSITSNQIGTKSNPIATIAGEDQLLVVWENTSKTGYEGIWGRLLTEDGSFVNDRFQILDQKPREYAIIGLNDGFAAVWQTGGNLYGRLFSMSGEPVTDFNIAADVDRIDGAGLENNTFVVCWSVPDTSRQDYGNWFIILDSSGNRIQDPVRVGPAEYMPIVFPLSNANFIIRWVERDEMDYDANEPARVYDQSGNSLSDIFYIVPPNTLFDANAQVASLSDDHFLVLWWRLRMNHSLQTQRFDLAGHKVGNEDTLKAVITGQQPSYFMSELNDATVNVIWVEKITGGKYGVHGRVISASGDLIGSEYIINMSLNRNTVPSMLPVAENGFALFWRSPNHDNSGSDAILAKFITAPDPSAALEPFDLIEPEDNIEFDETEVTFIWSKAESGDACLMKGIYYDVYLDTTDAFTSSEIIRGLSDTTVTADSLARGQEYFWKVQALNANGDSLFNSNGFRSFRIDDLFDIKVPIDYPTIQSAIDNAESGDAILIENGDYNELIDINRALTIEGADRDSVVISSPPGSEGPATVTISGSNIQLKNMTIPGRNGSGSLFDNILQNGGHAINISHAQQVVLEGLDLRGGDGDAASGNIGTDGGHGIIVDHSVDVYIRNLYAQGGDGGYGDGDTLASGDGGFGIYFDSSVAHVTHSTVSGGDGVTCYPLGSVPSAFGHALVAVNGSIVTVTSTDAAGAEDFWCPERSGISYFTDLNSYFIVDGVKTDIIYSELGMPGNSHLFQNYPNPFNPKTNIEFDVPESGMVTLMIYDIQGRMVQTPIDKELSSGHYTVTFDAGKLASGVYVYQLRIGHFRAMKKMLLMR